MPATILPNAFGGEPPLVPSHHCALEVGDACNQDVDGHDDEREWLEPVFGANAPFVLDHHKADTSGCCCIKLGVVEPSLHVDMGLVFQRPLCSVADAKPDGEEIGCQSNGDNQKCKDAAELGATGKLVK